MDFGTLLRLMVRVQIQNFKSTVRERMFIRLLEGLHKDEAKLLCAVKEKSLHQVYKGCIITGRIRGIWVE